MESASYTPGWPAHGVDPERLRLLGKKASALHTEQGKNLTEAVVDVLRDEPGLTPEHVGRVAEFANNATFERAFSKSTGEHRVINFDGGPADRARVIQELKSGSREGVMKTASRRGVMPIRKYIPGADGVRAGQMMKLASAGRPRVEYEWVNPHRELFELHDKLKVAKDELASRMVGQQVRYDTAVASMQKEARQIILAGHSPAEVSRIYVDRAPHPFIAKLALKLAAEAVTDVPAVPMTKEAMAGLSRPVDPNHALCTSFDNFAKVAEDFFGTVSALKLTRDQLSKVASEVKKVIQ